MSSLPFLSFLLFLSPYLSLYLSDAITLCLYAQCLICCVFHLPFSLPNKWLYKVLSIHVLFSALSSLMDKRCSFGKVLLWKLCFTNTGQKEVEWSLFTFEGQDLRCCCASCHPIWKGWLVLLKNPALQNHLSPHSEVSGQGPEIIKLKEHLCCCNKSPVWGCSYSSCEVA